MQCDNNCLGCSLKECIHDKNKDHNYEHTGKVGRPGKYPDGFKWERYYEDNKERIKARNRKRYQEKREELLEYGHKYYEEHRELWRKGGKYYNDRRKTHTILQENSSVS